MPLLLGSSLSLVNISIGNVFELAYSRAPSRFSVAVATMSRCDISHRDMENAWLTRRVFGFNPPLHDARAHRFTS